MQRVILRTLGDHRLLGKMTDAIETLAINVKCILLYAFTAQHYSATELLIRKFSMCTDKTALGYEQRSYT